MQVKDVMSSPVVTIGSGATLVEALRIMTGMGISGLPVVDEGGALVGMLTEGDLIRRAEIGSQRKRPRWLEYLLGAGRTAEDYIRTNSQSVGDLMSREPVAVAPEASLEEVAGLMTAANVKRLPVSDATGKVIGIVSRSDLLRALFRELEAGEAEAPLSDAQIQERLNQELGKAPWARTGTARASVKDGVVELSGAVFHNKERQALRIAAERIPGVRQVRDRMSLVQPVTGRLLPPEEN